MDILSVAVILIIAACIGLSFLKRFGMTQMLIIGNLVIFFITILAPYGVIQGDLGFRPTYLQNGENIYTVFTSMFIHNGAAHILFNMLFLFLIGLQLEDRVGKVKFAAVDAALTVDVLYATATNSTSILQRSLGEQD